MSGSGAGSEYEEHNMIMNYQIADFEPRPRQSAQLISWCPPLENWNPWIACNIDEGPEVSISMQELWTIFFLFLKKSFLPHTRVLHP